MMRIDKQISWKAQNIRLLTGFFFILISLTGFLAEEWWRLILFSFFPVGIVEIGVHFWNGRKKEYISWDNDKIEIVQPGLEPVIYYWEQIDEIKISQNNLTIKSGAANGMMVDLQNFRSEDIEQLKSMLSLMIDV